MPLPLCFSGVHFDLEPEVTTRRSQLIIERNRTTTTSPRIPVPVVYLPPPPIRPHYTHTETQVIVAEPREREHEPPSTVVNVNFNNQMASEIVENLARENVLRDRVSALENSLEEERRARASEESARYEREVQKIYEERESRRRSTSRGERRTSRSREVRHETVTREVILGHAAEEAARERISHHHHHHHRSSSHGRLAPPHGSSDTLMIMSEHSGPRHSRDRLAVTHTRSRSHEIGYPRCSFCNRHGHESDECSESEPEFVPVRRVMYWEI